MQYMPSPDYVEAGKFKLQRKTHAARLVGHDHDPLTALSLYTESYNQTLLEWNRTETTLLSYASIAAVTSHPTPLVQRIITDTFQTLIELSRRT